jgi:hypothetical protein
LGASVTPDEIGYLDNLTLTSGAVPEPASLSLLAIDAVGILRRRRRA